MQGLAAALVIALLAAATATAAGGAVPTKVVTGPSGDVPRTVPTTAQRIAILRATASTFRRVAAELPSAAPAQDAEANAAGGYAAWLRTQAAKMDALAAQGERALSATKDMEEQQMSFNLQYLQLQSQMQHENRSYTAVSNIMKTKHDTVKNSISNIR